MYRRQFYYSNKMNKMSIIELLNEFIEKDIYHKREMVILLLLDDTNFETLIDEFIDASSFDSKEKSGHNEKINIKIMSLFDP